MTEATCLTAKSFQRAFIAVKGIFLFLPLCFHVLSVLLFFKILGMGTHNNTDFYHFCFFMTCLAKSRQEPFHLQNLIDAMITAGAQMSQEITPKITARKWDKIPAFAKSAHLINTLLKNHTVPLSLLSVAASTKFPFRPYRRNRHQTLSLNAEKSEDVEVQAVSALTQKSTA